MKISGGRRKAVGESKIRARWPVLCCVLPIAFSLLAGCGKKGNPRAPELAVPEKIGDLKAQVEPAGVVLTWSRPMQYVDGKEIRDLAGFVIFRKELSRSCPDCPAPYRERITLNVEDQERFVKKRQYRFVDRGLSPGVIYRYRILSQLMDGSVSEPSNEVEIVWRS